MIADVHNKQDSISSRRRQDTLSAATRTSGSRMERGGCMRRRRGMFRPPLLLLIWFGIVKRFEAEIRGDVWDLVGLC
jgi:hypothetical protein